MNFTNTMSDDQIVYIEKPSHKRKKIYKAADKLPILLSILFGLQQVATCVSSIIAVPFVISSEICPGADLYSIRMKLVSLGLFISGLATIIQTEAGMRLALLQGPSYTFLPAIHAYLSKNGFPCNTTENDYVPSAEYETKLATVAGSLMTSALIPFVAGITGVVGAVQRYVGPITVSNMLFLVMYSTIDISIQRMAMHWMSIVQAALLFLTIFYLWDVSFPVVCWRNGKFRTTKSRIFERYPYLIAICLAWGICLILTVTDLTASDSPIRLDKNETLAIIKHAEWIHFPYPGEFGRLKFDMGLIVGCVVAACSTVIETVGTYYTAAMVSKEGKPPPHALNRGMIAEGIGTALAGLFGVGSGICTFSGNVGIMEITKVASRSMMVVAGILLMIVGLLTKFGAVLSTIPDPLLGAIIASSSSMVIGIAYANVQLVDLNLTRNMAIIGWSLMAGIMIPMYVNMHPIHTGYQKLDEVLLGFLSLPMFVGPFIACLLDNTAPGATRRQRGFFEEEDSELQENADDEVYNFPPTVTNGISKIPLLRSMPFLPKSDIRRQEFALTEKF